MKFALCAECVERLHAPERWEQLAMGASRCDGCSRIFDGSPCSWFRANAADIPLACALNPGHTPNARGMPDSIDDLERAVYKMRELGVTKWNGIELGPQPAAADDGKATDQPSGLTVDEAMRATRAERQRVASLASGGPVPAVGPKR